MGGMAVPGGPIPIKRASQIRIVSDGDGVHTRVYSDDGTEIRYVTGVDVHIRAGEPNEATLHVLAVNGEVTAEVAAIKETLVPEPSAVLVVKVGAETTRGWGYSEKSHSPIMITRHSNRGTDHTLVETVCEGWVSACEPFELTIPEVGA